MLIKSYEISNLNFVRTERIPCSTTKHSHFEYLKYISWPSGMIALTIWDNGVKFVGWSDRLPEMIKSTIYDNRCDRQMIQLIFWDYRASLLERSNRIYGINDFTLYDDQVDTLRWSSRLSEVIESTILFWASKNGQFDHLEGCPIFCLYECRRHKTLITRLYFCTDIARVSVKRQPPKKGRILGYLKFSCLFNMKIKIESCWRLHITRQKVFSL